MKTVLITGSQGYIGSVLTSYLGERGYGCRGYDIGFFKNCWLVHPYDPPTTMGDLRTINEEILDGVDVVVHLAAISNDPVGSIAPSQVYDPTRQYTQRLAQWCKQRGIRFIFPSSCSVYGIGPDRLLDETAEVHPQTPYSMNKWEIEQDLLELSGAQFTPYILRLATVFGPSPRMRLDLVINMLTAMAVVNKVIVLNSDGRAWRPSIFIDDVCQAIISCIEHRSTSGAPFVLNVGQTSQNFQIRDIAEMIRNHVPGSTIKYLNPVSPVSVELELVRDRKITDKGVDTRTYRVDFAAIEQALPGFRCQWTVEQGVRRLIEWYGRSGLTQEHLTDRRFFRLQTLEKLVEEGLLTTDLVWNTTTHPASAS